jgi:hypothetical protein
VSVEGTVCNEDDELRDKLTPLETVNRFRLIRSAYTHNNELNALYAGGLTGGGASILRIALSQSEEYVT